MDKEEFRDIVEAAQILSDIQFADFPALSERGLALAIRGKVNVDNKALNIAVGIASNFPQQHPTFFLIDSNSYEVLPHVEDDGYICYTHDDTLVLDADNKTGIVKETFDLAIQVLSDGFAHKNIDDFYNEYEAYWRRLKNGVIIYANIQLGQEAQSLKWTKGKGNDTIFVASDETERLASYERLFDAKSHPPQYRNGLYVPLINGAQIFVPRGEQELAINDLTDLISNYVSLENQKKVIHLLKKTRLEDVVIFSLLQPNGYYSIFGVRIKNIDYREHPLVSGSKATLVPLNVVRLDKEHLIARGGTGENFFSKKVLLVGAGSVGSIICEQLIKSGVLTITVVDKDTLQPENCYRHACGMSYLGKSKAVAMKIMCEKVYPHAEVTAIKHSIEEVIEKRKIDLNNFDAICIATGNVTLNLFLNRYLRQNLKKEIPILFSWLDPFGIGGHCLLTNINNKGCYQCLYSNDELWNSASFADKKQIKSFTKNISGCGSVYVPYGSLDSTQTAILAVRIIQKSLKKSIVQSSVFSWKGDSALFLSDGYKLSDRFTQSTEELERRESDFLVSNCKTCGSAKGII